MKVLDLFAGIGGFSLAAHWMEWETVAFVEWDAFCQKVLAKNFPNVPIFGDIKEFDGTQYNGTIDLICGGFPCQPFSVAGQRKGKEDDRYLWAEMLRIINEVQPKFVVGENVTGIIGLALDTVLSDLEAQGYTTETFIIPACGKNAWHRRDRVWIVAYANSIGWQNEQKENGQPLCNGNGNDTIEKQGREQQQRRTGEPGSILSNTESKLSNERENGNDTEQGEIQLQTGGSNSFSAHTNGIGWENGIHGQEQRGETSEFGNSYTEQYRNYWEAEPGVGRVVDGLPGRVDRLKGLGNAIVPQVVYEIFKAIKEVEI